MKKTGLIIAMILVIGVLAFCLYSIISINNVQDSEKTVGQTNQNMSHIEVDEQNTTENVIIDEEKKNEVTVNKVEEKNEINNEEKKDEVVNKESTEILKENAATNEEKALEIVKNDWKDETGVYFTTMGIDSKGRYIVTVNDLNTTGTLAWYLVDVTTGKFDIQ